MSGPRTEAEEEEEEEEKRRLGNVAPTRPLEAEGVNWALKKRRQEAPSRVIGK